MPSAPLPLTSCLILMSVIVVSGILLNLRHTSLLTSLIESMKKLILSAILSLGAFAGYSSVTVHYENQDRLGYVMKVKIDGAIKEIKIENGKAASLTIQGGNSACVIVTGCGDIEVNNGDRIVIHDKCVSVYKSLQWDYRHW